MQLKTQDQQSLGSAVVVAADPAGTWLVTSRHLVEAIRRVCVVPLDGFAEPAQVLAFRNPPARIALDLALIWQPASRSVGSGSAPRLVAQLANPMPTAANLPVVTASGYPNITDQEQTNSRYIESTGLLLPLLNTRIEGGYDLASSVSLRKGMSGGGLFLGDRLLGINGIHAQPLWSGALLDATGKPLSPDLNLQLEQVSLSISTPVMQRLLQTAVRPSDQDLKGIESMQCYQSKAPAEQPQPTDSLQLPPRAVIK